MIEVLQALADPALREIARALRSGRLFAPFTAVSLGRFCAAATAHPLALALQRLAAEGMRPDHLALLFEASLATRAARGDPSAGVELVWTGPEQPGMANRDTAVVVRELFAGARREVLVAGYAVYQGREVFRTLAARMDQQPELEVRMYLDVQRPHGDTSAEGEIVRRFAQRFCSHEWPGQRLPAVYYDPRSLAAEQGKRSSLHAKCVVVDRQTALVSSANFTEAAHLRNIEVGALVHAEGFAARLVEHFELLADAKLLLPLLLSAKQGVPLASAQDQTQAQQDAGS
jgi:phosphatidylserine/phosphatidylglycerophosphate/cardiolipin synthase-like enzyme